LILASISREGDSPLVVALFFILFAPHSAVFLSCEGANRQLVMTGDKRAKGMEKMNLARLGTRT
jgi:hypothetical protein